MCLKYQFATMSQNQSQLWAKQGIGFKQYTTKVKNVGQLWVKLIANYGLKSAWVLNNTTKAKIWLWVDNDQNNEPTKDQNTMGNLASFDFYFFFSVFFFLFNLYIFPREYPTTHSLPKLHHYLSLIIIFFSRLLLFSFRERERTQYRKTK